MVQYLLFSGAGWVSMITPRSLPLSQTCHCPLSTLKHLQHLLTAAPLRGKTMPRTSHPSAAQPPGIWGFSLVLNNPAGPNLRKFEFLCPFQAVWAVLSTEPSEHTITGISEAHWYLFGIWCHWFHAGNGQGVFPESPRCSLCTSQGAQGTQAGSSSEMKIANSTLMTPVKVAQAFK